MLVDTHAHLTSPELFSQVDQVIERAKKAGVAKIICASSNLKDSKQAIKLAKKYPGIVYASVGLHPHDTTPYISNRLASHCDTSKYRSGWEARTKEQLKTLEQLAEAKEVVAIGECGLDFTPPPPSERERPCEEQVYLFKEQVKLAIRLGKPLIVHSRKAFEETVEILEEFSQNTTTPGEPFGSDSTTLTIRSGSPRSAFAESDSAFGLPPGVSNVRQPADGYQGSGQQNTPGEGSAHPWGDTRGESRTHRGSPLRKDNGNGSQTTPPPESHGFRLATACHSGGEKNINGVFHCYSAGRKGIEKVNKLGFLFGVDGNLTYDEGLQNVFQKIPLEDIVLETDAPWLAPAPHRDKISEPVDIQLIAEFLAKLKRMNFAKITRITTENAIGLFSLD